MGGMGEMGRMGEMAPTRHPDEIRGPERDVSRTLRELLEIGAAALRENRALDPSLRWGDE